MKASTLFNLRRFMSVDQRSCINHLARGEEGEWFETRLLEIAGTIERMPKTYVVHEQEA